MWRKAKKPDDPAAARNSALWSLSRRDHSAQQLRRKLRGKGYAPEAIEHAVDSLREAGLQSDQRFTESNVRGKISRGRGHSRIKAELRAAGIADEQIQQAIEAEACDWQALARQTLERKFPDPPTDQRERARQSRFLAARGFSPQHIRAAMSRS